MILPIFAFANAGVSFSGMKLNLLWDPVTLGIILGLFFGKQIGVMLFTYVGSLLRVCKLPSDISWAQYYGLSLVTGIGFTMSLFIGSLAFTDPEYQTSVRLGVLIASSYAFVCNELQLSYIAYNACNVVLISLKSISLSEKFVASIRNAVGDKCDILFGTHGQMTYSSAVRLAKKIERYDRMPKATFVNRVMGDFQKITTEEIFPNKKIVLFGLPGHLQQSV